MGMVERELPSRVTSAQFILSDSRKLSPMLNGMGILRCTVCIHLPIINVRPQASNCARVSLWRVSGLSGLRAFLPAPTRFICRTSGILRPGTMCIDH